MPTAEQLRLIAGNKIRLNPDFLPTDARSPREVFRVADAPAPDALGMIVAIGLLSGVEVAFTKTEYAIAELVKD